MPHHRETIWRRDDADIYMLSRYEVAIGDRFGFDYDLSGATSLFRPRLADDKTKSLKFTVPKNNNAPRVCGSVFIYPSKVSNKCLSPARLADSQH
jgi:hypothetical protein